MDTRFMKETYECRHGKQYKQTNKKCRAWLGRLVRVLDTAGSGFGMETLVLSYSLGVAFLLQC